MTLGYEDTQPTRAEVDTWVGPAALEFGANWCGICLASRPRLDETLAAWPDVPRVKVADGPGLPLGRSFGIRLWPTLVLLRDGTEVDRLVRPRSRSDLAAALEAAFSR